MITRSPSLRLVRPDLSTAEMWTNTSLSPLSPSDEAEALLGVEPPHRALLLDRCVGRWPTRCRPPKPRLPWCPQRRGAGINAQYLGHVWAFMSRTHAYFEGFTGLHGADAALSKHALMEEAVAGPVREFDEPKPLFGIEPFDESVDWRAGGWVKGLAKPESSAESTRLWVVRVSVEF